MMLSNTDMIYATYEPFNHSACLCNVIATQCYWSQCYWDISGAVLWSVFLTPPVTPLCIVCSDRTYVSRGNLSWKSGPRQCIWDILEKLLDLIGSLLWKMHLSVKMKIASFSPSGFIVFISPWDTQDLCLGESHQIPREWKQRLQLKRPCLLFRRNIFASFEFPGKYRHQADFLHSCGTGIQKSSWGQRERENILKWPHHLRYIIEYW